MNASPNSITYLISGLGADKRVFQKLNLDIGEFKHIPWHEPIKNQTLKTYSLELIEKHLDQTRPI